MRRFVLPSVLLLFVGACASGEGDSSNPLFTTSGNTSDPTSSGDGDSTTGDGDEDPTTTGDGDPTTGDGDGDPTTTGDGDPTTTGDGDAVCGNDMKEGDEECDGNDLGGLNCLDFGFQDGTLVCANDCTLFTNACSTCGDGQLSPTESCDGSNFGGLTCTDLGYGSGTLSCAADCKSVIESGCVPAASCGDGVVNPGEDCDGGNLGGNTCVSLGYDGGTLSCTAGCQLNVANCTTQTCGEVLEPCNVLFPDCCEGLDCIPLLGCLPP